MRRTALVVLTLIYQWTLFSSSSEQYSYGHAPNSSGLAWSSLSRWRMRNVLSWKVAIQVRWRPEWKATPGRKHGAANSKAGQFQKKFLKRERKQKCQCVIDTEGWPRCGEWHRRWVLTPRSSCRHHGHRLTSRELLPISQSLCQHCWIIFFNSLFLLKEAVSRGKYAI